MSIGIHVGNDRSGYNFGTLMTEELHDWRQKVINEFEAE